MSNCLVPMPTYERPEPVGELVDSLKRENDALKERIRELEDERRIWIDGWAVNRITELETLVSSLYADYYDEWPDRAEECYAERIAALGIEVDA